jgi:hypothetical protein
MNTATARICQYGVNKRAVKNGIPIGARATEQKPSIFIKGYLNILTLYFKYYYLLGCDAV